MIRPLILLLIVACPASAACSECHAEIVASYQQTPMAQSFGAVAPGAKLPPLATLRHETSRQSFALLERNQRPVLRRTQGTNILERTLDYWIGSGNHARSYLSRNVSGDLVELPVTWYSEKQGYWAMSPAYDYPEHAGFSRKITDRCMFCHMAYPAGAPAAIDCQRCHGPGGNHTSAARLGRPVAEIRAAITNPARLPEPRRTEVCLQCHLETTNQPVPSFQLRPGRSVFSYRPGEPLGDYGLYFDHAPGTGHDDKFEFASAPYRLRQSACFVKSKDTLTCTTCHKPHGRTSTAEYDQACLTCHTPLPAEHSAKQDCVSCHMPTGRPDDAIRTTITDHRIARTPVLRRPDPPVERNGSNTAPFRGSMVLYYPETAASKSPEPAPAMEDGPKALAARLTAAGKLAEAVEVLRAAVTADPDSADLHNNFGLSLLRIGREQDAERSLVEAVRLRPELPPIRVNLAALYSRQRRWPAAIEQYREALATRPGFALVHLNLGMALAAINSIAEARSHLEYARDHGDGELRQAAIRAMGQLGAGR